MTPPLPPASAPRSLSVLFWNMKGKASCVAPLAELVEQHGADVLLVAEGPYDNKLGQPLDLVPLLAGGWRRLELPKVPGDPTPAWRRPHAPLAFYTRSPAVTLLNDEYVDLDPEPGSGPDLPEEPGVSGSNLLLIGLQLGRQQVLLAGVHLPSKLYKTEAGQAAFAQNCQQVIVSQEANQGSWHTVVVGDFNMSPYEPGMVDRSRGFHTVSSRYVARDRHAVPYLGRTRRFYYNPMWALLGDFVPHTNEERPPGTYYRPPQNPDEPYWQCLDGVLVSPEALPVFERSSLNVLVRSASHELSDGHRLLAGYSDHLPVFFTLRA